MPYASVHGHLIADNFSGALDGLTNSVPSQAGTVVPHGLPPFLTGDIASAALQAVAGPLPALAALAAAAAAVVLAVRPRVARSGLRTGVTP